MLAALPKLADKAFILGFFLPVLLLVLVSLALFADVVDLKSLLETTTAEHSLEKLFYFVLAVWGAAVLMLLVNNVQYKILEGYLWPVSRLAWLRKAEKRRFNKLQGRVDALLAKRSKHELADGELQELEKLWLAARANFATDASLLLPTRFGNAILAFEEYSKEVYGADSVTLWFHLTSVMSSSFQSALSDARAQVNCLVNLCFFSAIICLIAIARFSRIAISAFSTQPPYLDLHLLFEQKSLSFLGAAVVAAIATRLTYNLSIERIRTWGDLVRAAFDCFLPALAKKLGYKLPATGADQRDFWGAVSRRVALHYPFKPEQWAQTDSFDSEPKKQADQTDRAEAGDEDGEDEDGEEEGEETCANARSRLV